MKKFLLTFCASIFALSIVATDEAIKSPINTIQVNSPMKLLIYENPKDTVFSIQSQSNELRYVVKEDTILQLRRNRKWVWEEYNDDTVKVVIKTPKPIKITTSRELQIH
jgi:hypothetical protein